MKYLNQELEILEQKLELLILDEKQIFSISDKGILACKQALIAMRQSIMDNGFKTQLEELHFFKSIKPKVVGYMFFYINLVNIERHKTLGTLKTKRKFFSQEMALLRQFFLEHREFYEYHLRGLDSRDTEFFTRTIRFQDLHFDSISSIIDTNFSTSHDMILARIIGNTLTIEHLKKELYKINRGVSIETDKKRNNLKWTGAKIDLVELVYALHSSGLINNGNVDLKELATSLELLFSVEVGDFYRKFIEIRDRKTNRTKLLDLLKTGLSNRMVAADN